MRARARARDANHLYKTIIVMYTDSDMRCMLSGGGDVAFDCMPKQSFPWHVGCVLFVDAYADIYVCTYMLCMFCMFFAYATSASKASRVHCVSRVVYVVDAQRRAPGKNLCVVLQVRVCLPISSSACVQHAQATYKQKKKYEEGKNS